jgi:transposase-like protein
MSHYSAERKEVILKQLLPPHNRTVTEVSAHEGISTATLYNWRNKAKLEGVPVPGRSKSAEGWSSEAKLAVVVETIALSESELSEYCRQKGLYPEQVKTWKQDCLAGFESTPARKAQALKQSKSDRKQIRKLEKELRRKEKALAETAALLVLRKKLNAFYEEDQEDD